MKELIIFASGIVMGAWLMEEYRDDILEPLNSCGKSQSQKENTKDAKPDTPKKKTDKQTI